MSYMKVNVDRCVGCGECVADCPFGVIRLENHLAVMGKGCRLCSTCEMTCPSGAIEFVSGEGTGTVKEADDFHF